ncbi:hypothetical protein TanjilG_01259 [Lupinus angustifolius]|uniref:Uncharacterized protein n=1 Tax=Lupinus angustifolius TaxID=3871 RepID=A0A4P1REM6_LUPAN|nr:PREDICTED: uncharacterized protein LOC109350739 [Lupinus angustifolius]OIW09288.1 hypothetical protein TanjilG_01259 [Lupinus angustifolius]
MIHDGVNRESSKRPKLKYSICCFSSTISNDALEQGELYYNKLNTPRTPTTPISPSSWFKKSIASEFCGDPPQVRARSLKFRMGRRHNRRTSQSVDFSYDPLSYALNFENEGREEFSSGNFSSRLPVSPPVSPSSTKFSEELTRTLYPKKLLDSIEIH